MCLGQKNYMTNFRLTGGEEGEIFATIVFQVGDKKQNNQSSSPFTIP